MIDPQIANFVGELRRISSEESDSRGIVERLKPLVKKLVDEPTWLSAEMRRCDPEQGFGVHLLHEEADHRLAVLVAAWLPGRGIPPHDHGTWSVVGGIEGSERNVFWRRVDDGSVPGRAELVVDREIDIRPGDVISNFERDIHSVRNDSAQVTISLHVYGKHINHTDRYGFDVDNKAMKRLTVAIGK